MKWVRFERDGKQGIGRLHGETVRPVEAKGLREVIEGRGTRAVGGAIPLGGTRLWAPLRPGKIIAVGQNYWDHCREQKKDPPKRPILFAKFPLSVIGPGDEVRWPQDLTSQVDYEAELALVIGRTARSIPEDSALDYLFG